MNIDREHIERLLSERADGRLSPEQVAVLDRAITDHAGLASAARRYERLNGLLRKWRVLPSDLNWQDLSGQIRSRVAEEAELATSNSVDDLVQDALGPMPEVDWAGLKNRISAAVHEEALSVSVPPSRRSWSRTSKWLAVVGAPLAAAAAIVLAIWSPWSEIPLTPAAPIQIKSVVVVSFEKPQTAGHVKVAFDETPFEGSAIEDEMTGAAIAKGPPEAFVRERFEEVVLY